MLLERDESSSKDRSILLDFYCFTFKIDVEEFWKSNIIVYIFIQFNSDSLNAIFKDANLRYLFYQHSAQSPNESRVSVECKVCV